ncbi:hypothetical protein ACWDZ4_33690 [Streptomyces sp. NPDC003016]
MSTAAHRPMARMSSTRPRRLRKATTATALLAALATGGGLAAGTATAATPPQAAAVHLTVEDVPFVRATPGDPAEPMVRVTNTGNSRIATQNVTLTLGPRGVSWLGWQEVYIVRNGRTEKNRCSLSDTNPKQATCKNVKLSLEPGQSINLHTEVATSPTLKPCEIPRVHFDVGGIDSANANFIMDNPDGTPAQCH